MEGAQLRPGLAAVAADHKDTAGMPRLSRVLQGKVGGGCFAGEVDIALTIRRDRVDFLPAISRKGVQNSETIARESRSRQSQKGE